MMAADLQEPVSLVREFFERARHGRVRRRRRRAQLARRRPRQPDGVAALLVALPAPRATGDPGGRRRRLRLHPAGGRRAHRAWTSRTRASSGSSTGSASGGPRCRTTACRGRRARARWSFRRKMRYLLDSIFSFTDLPITLIIALGVIGVAVSTMAALAVLVGVGDRPDRRGRLHAAHPRRVLHDAR